jgi:hypothetical protein
VAVYMYAPRLGRALLSAPLVLVHYATEKYRIKSPNFYMRIF